MARLLFVSTPIYGHFAPLRSIAADLIGRGHDATFITGAAFEDAARSTGARFVPFHTDADLDITAFIRDRADMPPGPGQVNHDMMGFFIAPVAVQHEMIQRELAAAGGEPVVLITDSWALGGWPVALGPLACGQRAPSASGSACSPL